VPECTKYSTNKFYVTQFLYLDYRKNRLEGSNKCKRLKKITRVYNTSHTKHSRTRMGITVFTGPEKSISKQCKVVQSMLVTLRISPFVRSAWNGLFWTYEQTNQNHSYHTTSEPAVVFSKRDFSHQTNKAGQRNCNGHGHSDEE